MNRSIVTTTAVTALACMSSISAFAQKQYPEQEKMKQDEMKQDRMKLVIGHLYPDLLNLYGDRGNIQCFRKRLEWRGMEAEVIPFLSGDKIDFSKLDIVLLGGGSDREQELVCGFLKDIREDFQSSVPFQYFYLLQV